ncbi:unnamed protein product [Nyctereutes procyonoides]|uniref:(raccoon dog) hypothetical protein n=1 Tax=Nyctereutes procyonoides TaxID=34880 RepID=A0A811XRL1_NYCPR|nr:unnamed protein product [Nyctereutes procyonoides]
MDPCTGGNGYAHICQSENGVARCVCHPGYQLSEDKKACGGRSCYITLSANMNKHAEGLAHCHHCSNTMESFICACHPGFELGADGKQCCALSGLPGLCGEVCCYPNIPPHESVERFLLILGGDLSISWI